MRAEQSELGLAVVEVDRLEALDVMARGTVGAELAKMDVIRLVAGNTLVRGIAVLCAGLVAGSTGHSGMRAFQLEIGLLVAESVRLEPDDGFFARCLQQVKLGLTYLGSQIKLALEGM